MVAGAEAFARHSGYVRFAEQPAREIGGRFDSTTSNEGRNVGIGVERSFRQGALHSRNRAQPFNYVVAQLDVFEAHFLHALLRAVQCRHRSLLHD